MARHADTDTDVAVKVNRFSKRGWAVPSRPGNSFVNDRNRPRTIPVLRFEKTTLDQTGAHRRKISRSDRSKVARRSDGFLRCNSLGTVWTVPVGLVVIQGQMGNSPDMFDAWQRGKLSLPIHNAAACRRAVTDGQLECQQAARLETWPNLLHFGERPRSEGRAGH